MGLGLLCGLGALQTCNKIELVMEWEYIGTIGIVIALLAYLIYAMVYPEKF
jgi:K+-transporting ATPase KdpF subunit